MKSPLTAIIRKLLSAAKRIVGRRAPGRLPDAGRFAIGSVVNRILSDAILFNEMRSLPEGGTPRTDFISRKLSEFGYSSPHVDECGNVSIAIPAREPTDQHVLLFADIGGGADAPMDRLVTLEKDRARGTGLAENSIGVAALLVLAEYIAASGLSFDRNILLLFTVFDPGHQDIQPLESFLRIWQDRLLFAVHVRSLTLGRIEERPMGTCKLPVAARTEQREVMGAEGAHSAISVLAAIASRLGSIRWDPENNTFLNIARLEAGAGFGWHAAEGVLELEIFSTNASALEVARTAVSATIGNIATETHAAVDIVVKAFFPAGKAEINAGLNEVLRRVYGKLRIKPRPISLPDHSAFINSMGIPSVSLGVTTGSRSHTEESVDTRPIETGFRLLLAFLDETAGRGGGGVA